MKKTSTPVTNIGTVSLITVFIVLSLIVFSTLSLASALRDNHLSRRLVSRNTGYYTASGKANLKLHEIDEVFLVLDADRSDAGQSRLIAALNELDSVTADESDGRIVIEFSEAISTDSQLSVRLTVSDPGSSEFYRISQWQEVSTRSWSGDDTYNLMP